MSSTLKVALVILGFLLVLVGILGSGISIREISFPRVGGAARIVSLAMGSLLVITGAGLLIFSLEDRERSDPPTVAAPLTSGNVNPTMEGVSESSRLEQRVPSDIRDDCDPIEEPGVYPSSTATLLCTTPESDVPGSVWYNQFASAAEMMSDVTADNNRSVQGELPPKSCKTSEDVQGTGSYSVGNETVGDLYCYKGTEDDVWFVWTDNRYNIASYASAPASRVADLYAWWTKAGPT